MNKKYDVIIVGGGLFGCSTAYHLCQQSSLKVALIERGMIGMQTSSLAASLVTRARASVPLIQLGQGTFRAIHDLEKLLGDALDFNDVGSMHIAQSVESAENLAKQTRLIKIIGDTPIELTPQQAMEKAPWLNLAEAESIIFNPLDGFIDPYRLASAYLKGAKAHGGLDVYQSTEVLELITKGNQISGVQTSEGTMACEQLVVAAGPWANHLLKPVGSRSAIAPVRSHYWITATDDRYPVTSPVVIMPEANAYARPEVGGLLFGLRDGVSTWAHPKDLPDDLQGFSFDDDFGGWNALANAAEPFLELCPSVGDVDIHHYISGPSGYTPDGKYVLGKAPELNGVYLASGCCGTGVAMSGGFGQAIAEMVLGSAPSIDLSDFNPNRFGSFDPYDQSFIERCALSRSQKKAG